MNDERRDLLVASGWRLQSPRPRPLARTLAAPCRSIVDPVARISHAQRFGARRCEMQRTPVRERFEQARVTQRKNGTWNAETRGVAGREAKQFPQARRVFPPSAGSATPAHGAPPFSHRARRSSATPLMKPRSIASSGCRGRSSASPEPRRRSVPGWDDVDRYIGLRRRRRAPAGHSRHAIRGRQHLQDVHAGACVALAGEAQVDLDASVADPSAVAQGRRADHDPSASRSHERLGMTSSSSQARSRPAR